MVVSPLAVTSTVVDPAEGAAEDESTRRTVNWPGVPFQLDDGLKRRL